MKASWIEHWFLGCQPYIFDTTLQNADDTLESLLKRLPDASKLKSRLHVSFTEN